jgi:PAS domain-containing protein
LLGGFGPAALGTLLAALLTALWGLPSQHPGLPLDLRDWIGLAAFVVMGLLMSAVAHLFREGRGRLLFFEGPEGLSRTEERYRLLADNAHDVIWTFDLSTSNFTYVSPSIMSLRGLTVEEALAEPVSRA